MTRRKTFAFASVFASTVVAVAGAAAAQTRVTPQTTPPARPQAVQPQPLTQHQQLVQKLDALGLRLDALEQTVRRQIVVLEWAGPGHGNGPYTEARSFPEARAAAELRCQIALDDRYGRVISHQQMSDERGHWLGRAVCEAK